MEQRDAQQVLRILLVEDNPFHLRMVRAMLGEAIPEAEVREAATMSAALEHLTGEMPDCVLLDLMLPDASRAEAVAAVGGAAPGVPIIVLSAHDDPELEREVRAAGVGEYLVKGLADSADLRAGIASVVERVVPDAGTDTGISGGATWSGISSPDVVVSVA